MPLAGVEAAVGACGASCPRGRTRPPHPAAVPSPRRNDRRPFPRRLAVRTGQSSSRRVPSRALGGVPRRPPWSSPAAYHRGRRLLLGHRLRVLRHRSDAGGAGQMDGHRAAHSIKPVKYSAVPVRIAQGQSTGW
ncbi:hypothetical protein QJS66_17190 [Kocuria rhizophila]|nr:hypothetical protein QJS66_17190 [Kocuria rhizophila]